MSWSLHLSLKISILIQPEMITKLTTKFCIWRHRMMFYRVAFFTIVVWSCHFRSKVASFVRLHTLLLRGSRTLVSNCLALSLCPWWNETIPCSRCNLINSAFSVPVPPWKYSNNLQFTITISLDYKYYCTRQVVWQCRGLRIYLTILKT